MYFDCNLTYFPLIVCFIFNFKSSQTSCLTLSVQDATSQANYQLEIFEHTSHH